MEGTIFSIIPAVIMLVLVLLTRKVLISLGVGIVAGALMIHEFSILSAIEEIWYVFYTIFIVDGAINTGNILLITFLLFLGMMTALLQASGGSRAFGDWMMARIKTRKGAQLMTPVLGLIIFIDDYFNALAVGQIARPITDRHRVSRAKLAYFIDSTSAPITVISPISSWGAYIIGILGGLFAANEVTDYQPLSAFLQMVPLNLYAVAALLLVFLTAYFQLNLGAMHKHERRAVEEGQLLNPDQDNVPGDLGDTFEPHQAGKVYHLLAPIIVLIVVTVTAMVVTGAQASEREVDILAVFANTDVNLSLFLGGTAAVMTGLILHFMQEAPRANTGRILSEGIKTMLPAIYILVLAWMIGSIIGTLETGEYLAQVVSDANVSGSMLPFIFFLIAGLMAVGTGTSWGTFGIMLPIAAEVAVTTDIHMLLPALAAVLAGAVFGDHCTPISDTTILSSTGAGSNHIDHVITQLPYAGIAAGAAGAGYLLLGLTSQAWLSLLLTAGLVILIASLIYMRKK
ncbi:Na+/H+ antiporter NhaC family protein [Virgibacillus xinjiangensis]|uniref:Na+/H+ antiporter NhaC family protein n=1 Tax=Virgibacillus xinjiangensis TaxID=393090 RepID=A0ABV7CYK2_9BACI